MERTVVKVLVTEPNTWESLPGHPALPDEGIELTYVDPDDRSALLSAIADVDVYVGLVFDEEIARVLAPRCRHLLITAAGTDHVATGALPSGVRIANAYGHEASVAEHVLMVMLAARRGLVWRDAALRRGIWRTRLSDPSAPSFGLLDGRTVALVGFGHIGQAILGPLAALGARSVVIRRSPTSSDDPRIAWVGNQGELGRACDESDVLVLACPLNDETRGMIGRDELDRLGPGGCLVNVGRGGLVDERELFLALRERRLGSAALDVWGDLPSLEYSRPSPYPFEDLDNVVMTPHYSGTATDTYTRRTAGVAENLARIARGEEPANVVTVT